MKQISDQLVEERERLLAYFRSQGFANEAQDLFQDLAVVALRSKPEDESLVRSWLFGVARNLVRREMRRHRLDALPIDVASPVMLESSFEEEELRRCVFGLLERIDPVTRTAVESQCYDGLTLTESARQLGLSANSLSARIMRGRKKVLETLTQEDRTFLGDYGILFDDRNPTTIWCPRCGVENLFVSPPGLQDRSEVRCPSCELFLAEGGRAKAFAGTPKVAIGRFIRFARQNAESYRESRDYRCSRCRRLGRMSFDEQGLELSFQCEYCESAFLHASWELALSHPAGHEFWRRHKRIREVQIGRSEFQFESVREPGQAIAFGFDKTQGLRLLDDWKKKFGN